MNLKHLKTCIAFSIMNFPMNGKWRPFFVKIGGVDIDGRQTFIGRNVEFDSMNPGRIHIDRHVHITSGCKILTHYLDARKDGIHFYDGDVYIGKHTFIGVNTIICNSVRIGDNVIIGAGSIVTKDIPDNEIWAGNPARLIRKR